MSMAAVRVSMRWLGVRKTLTNEQKDLAAESFGAEGAYWSARKKLPDTRPPVFKELTAVRGRILSYWKGCSLPYPEPGIRLIKHQRIDDFHRSMEDLQTELARASRRLNDHFADLKTA